MRASSSFTRRSGPRKAGIGSESSRSLLGEMILGGTTSVSGYFYEQSVQIPSPAALIDFYPD
ncbi:hypothetical protein [Puniceicoccus vermicola]|uniref:hypothetical protein n=1 Tax=Puniceicoccus vermicola TaxID=388746 RepID=UPI00339435BD